jgi:hypothetical protein
MFGCVQFFLNREGYRVPHLKGGGLQEQQQLQVQAPPSNQAQGTPPDVGRVQESQARPSSPSQPRDQIPSSDFPEHYMVFSTSCSTDQNWQSYVFFFYAAKVKQPGHVVRIASGCSQKEQDDLTKFHTDVISKLSSDFSLHFTPDFTKISGDDYKYYNKPFGLQHWMKHGLKFAENKRTAGDAIIMILDPDMMLLRPMTYDFTNTGVLLHNSKRGPPEDMRVTHGQPWASLYGFGSGPFQVDLKHVFANHTDSPALLVPKEEQNNNYAGGPPYMATGRDMFAIVNLWCELVPRVHSVYGALLGEMYGWSLAAAHLRLPHTLAESFMVSATDIIEGEGWPLIDQLKDDEVCDYAHRTPKKSVTLPFVIHYCQSYWLGKYFVGKYRINSDFMSCAKALLFEPPKDITQWRYDYFIRPGGVPYGSKEKIKNPKTPKREQFMICQITTRLNDAATWYKDLTCEKGKANNQKSFIFHHNLDPSNNEGGEKTTKW